MEIRTVTEGLDFPEGPVALADGSVLLVEIAAGTLTRVAPDGTKTVVNQMGPGDFLGELALLDNGIRTATAVTKEPVKCLVLARWDFIAALREDADMAVTILEELARRFRLALDVL